MSRVLDTAPLVVGGITLAFGTALVVSPGPTSAAMRLGEREDVARAVGIADLALVPGLLRGRPRWPWMLARAALNVAIAEVYRAEAARPGGLPGARVGRYAMLGLTVVDSAVAVALHRRG